ncbi:MAG: AraC family transcriptional regulator [Lachnospiraceae bacterium]|nr:AraC family transcriptional regulator [Lachnospiraceae bacterium]
MKDNEITITETLADLEKRQLEYAIRMEDEEEYTNHSYRDEQILMQAIKDGNVKLVERLLQTPLSFPKAVERGSRKNEEYMTAIWVALAARAAIEAGIASRESFLVSDIFLKQIAGAMDARVYLAIRKRAALTYAGLVAEHRKSGKKRMYVGECKNYIAVNIFKRISSRDVAAELNLNVIYLERIFKEEEEVTIGQYIQREKIKRAKNILKYSDRSLTEVGDYLGYSSQSHFGTVFKKETGMTPRQYRDANHVTKY